MDNSSLILFDHLHEQHEYEYYEQSNRQHQEENQEQNSNCNSKSIIDTNSINNSKQNCKLTKKQKQKSKEVVKKEKEEDEDEYEYECNDSDFENGKEFDKLGPVSTFKRRKDKKKFSKKESTAAVNSSIRNPLSLKSQSQSNKNNLDFITSSIKRSIPLSTVTVAAASIRSHYGSNSNSKSNSQDECNFSVFDTVTGTTGQSSSDFSESEQDCWVDQTKRRGNCYGRDRRLEHDLDLVVTGNTVNSQREHGDENDHFPLILSQGHHLVSNSKSKSKSKSILGSNSNKQQQQQSSTGGESESESVPVPARKMSLFRAFTRRNNSHSKHKKLNEGWMLGDSGCDEDGSGDLIVHGVTFYVKFLGSALIEKAGRAEAAEATKTVIQMVKAGKKSLRVGLTVSSSGIRIVNGSTGELTSHISIYDIAHCSSDANYPNVFSFIATNKNETNECYCFASPKRKMAQKVTLTIAEAFNLAFELWQNSCVAKQSLLSSEKRSPIRSESHEERQWVHFDEEEDGLSGLNGHLENIHLRTYSINRQRRQGSLEDHDPHHSDSDHQDLLICLH